MTDTKINAGNSENNKQKVAYDAFYRYMYIQKLKYIPIFPYSVKWAGLEAVIS